MASIFTKEPSFQPEDPDGNLIYRNPTPSEITLLAGFPTDQSIKLTSTLTAMVSNCGFNAIGASVPVSELDNALNNCSNSKLKLLLHNESLFENGLASISSSLNNPSLAGWVLRNDIGIKEYSDENIVNQYEILRTADTGLPIYMGLNGDWNQDKEDPQSFPSFIAGIQNWFKPSFWSFFYLPDILPQGSNEDYSQERASIYYRDLQYFADISQYMCSPFWVTCRCQSFDNYNGFKSSAPTYEMLRGQIFSALAYGAQGIYFWNFFQSPNLNNNTFKDAPIGNNGIIQNQTLYNDLQRVILEVRAFQHVFYGAEVIDCRFVWPNLWPAGLKRLEYPMLPLKSIGGERDVIPGLLVAQLFNKGKNYLVLVNNPYLKTFSVYGYEFSEYFNVKRLTLENNIEGEDTERIVDPILMRPGEYMIFTWE